MRQVLMWSTAYAGQHRIADLALLHLPLGTRSSIGADVSSSRDTIEHATNSTMQAYNRLLMPCCRRRRAGPSALMQLSHTVPPPRLLLV